MTEQIRVTYDVRRATREQLVSELDEFATHRASQGKQARADGAWAAAQKLIEGADRVQFEYTVYVVADEASRGGVRRGTRAWVLAELDEAGKGWTHFGNRPLVIAHAAAIAEIESGAARVQVGHIEYEVADEA
jgi:hypothetical protein